MEVKLTNVFHRTGQALINAMNGTGPRLIINQGGQGSSKTFSTLQVIYNHLIGSERKKVTFCSYALPHLKKGVCSDFDSIITSFGENLGKVKSSPAQPLYRIHKSEIDCYGVEGNLALAHGPRRDLLFINECNRKIGYDVFDQLFSRSKVTLVDFNPDAEFWLHEKVLPNFPHVLIKSNFMDNPYLPDSELQNILLKRDKPGFENWWKVYGLGELGSYEGVVFPNWRYANEGEFEESIISYPNGYGLDYGFHPDPDAMVMVAFDKRGKRLFVKEMIYKTNNGTEDLIDQIKSFYRPPDLIVAESASPRTNADLSKYYNLKPVQKTRTVAEWLREMQDYEIIITEDSDNMAKELRNYLYNDKKAGIPVDAFNHGIDALRYYFMNSQRKTYF